MDDLERIQLLLVDDEEEFLDATSRALSRRGFEVRTARDGRQALTIIGTRPVDVVVLDIKMPGIDGVEVFHRIRRSRRGLPVIMLTGHGSVQQAFETSRDGVYGFMSKPCSVEQLAETARRAVQEVRRPGEALPADTGEARVLLVDDEPELLGSLSRTLTRRGFQVMSAERGEQALELLARQVFDVALLDLKMPGLSGLDLLRRVKAAQPGMEAIVLTGHSTMEEAVEGIKVGAFDFLRKPQSVAVLVEKIREAAVLAEQRRRKEQRRRVERSLGRLND